MVFQHLNLSNKFVNMKNILSNKLLIGAIILVFTYLSFGFKTIVQTFKVTCGSAFHGVGQIVTNCDEEIIITSLPEDGEQGSLIVGNITSSNRIHILPGTESVKILPTLETSKVRQTIASASGKGLPVLRRSVFRTSVDGRSIKGNDNVSFIYNSSSQTVSITNLESPIVHYGIYDMSGLLLTEVDGLQALKFNIPISHLNDGVYIIIIVLENEEPYHGKIAKS